MPGKHSCSSLHRCSVRLCAPWQLAVLTASRRAATCKADFDSKILVNLVFFLNTDQDYCLPFHRKYSGRLPTPLQLQCKWMEPCTRMCTTQFPKALPSGEKEQSSCTSCSLGAPSTPAQRESEAWMEWPCSH